jgi:hypothetical protein
MPVHYRYSGDKEAGIAIKRTVDRELDKHLDNTRLGNLEQNRSVTTFVNGTTIECKSIFNNHLVNVFVPVGGGKKEDKKKLKVIEIKQLIFYLWVNDDADGNKRIRLWDSNLKVIGRVLSNTLENFYPDVDEKYINAEGCEEYNDYYGFGDGLGKGFFSQLEYSSGESSLKELVAIEDLDYDNEDGWVGRSQVVYYSESSDEYPHTDITYWNPDKYFWLYVGSDYTNVYDNVADATLGIGWCFDGDENLVFPEDGLYNAYKITEYINTYWLVIEKYNAMSENPDGDYREIKKTLIDIWLYNYYFKYIFIARRNTVATGWYWMGMKDAYPELAEYRFDRNITGQQVDTAGSAVCQTIGDYEDSSCYIYMLRTYNIDEPQYANKLYYSENATDSSGDYADYFDDPIPNLLYPEQVYTIKVNDPFDGEREYEVETIPQVDDYDSSRSISMYSKIYNYGGKPLYTYTIFNLFRNKIWYGYIYKDKHVKNEEFEITGNILAYPEMEWLHEFGESVKGETIMAYLPYWQYLHAAILTTKKEVEDD